MPVTDPRTAGVDPDEELAIRALLAEDVAQEKAKKLGAAYPGNLGAMEMFKFYRVATPAEKALMESLLKSNQERKAWDLLKKVTGVPLQDPAWLHSHTRAATDLGGQARAFPKKGSSDLSAELERRVDHLIADYEKALASGTPVAWADLRTIGEPFAAWFTTTFRVELPVTPSGGKAIKELAKKFLWAARNSVAQQQNTGMIRDDWAKLKPQVPAMVGLFSDQGNEVLREIKTPIATYLNLRGAATNTFKSYVKALDAIFGAVRGWRAKALSGDFKVGLAGPESFRGTSKGRYNENSDTLFVRATPEVMKRSGKKYASPEYILIHELGHRYEAKVGVHYRFDMPSWYTTRYSMAESGMGHSEAFAELFALGHFGITSYGSDQFADKLVAFDQVLETGKSPMRTAMETETHMKQSKTAEFPPYVPAECPVCKQPEVGRCRCWVGDKSCGQGHKWVTCPVDKNRIVPAKDTHSSGGFRRGECWCDQGQVYPPNSQASENISWAVRGVDNVIAKRAKTAFDLTKAFERMAERRPDLVASGAIPMPKEKAGLSALADFNKHWGAATYKFQGVVYRWTRGKPSRLRQPQFLPYMLSTKDGPLLAQVRHTQEAVLNRSQSTPSEWVISIRVPATDEERRTHGTFKDLTLSKRIPSSDGVEGVAEAQALAIKAFEHHIKGRENIKTAKVKTAKSNAKVLEVPASFSPVVLQEPKATRKEFPFEGFIDFQGIKIDVENAKGSTRSGTGPEGDWSTYMFTHYGEIRGTEGTDGDKLDVYVGDNHDSSLVVVIHQHNPWDGQYDEDKVVLGCESVEEAIGLYKKQYDRPGFFKEKEYTAMPIGAFWRWVNEEKNKGKKVKLGSKSAPSWKKGYTEGKAGVINGAKIQLSVLLAYLRSLTWNYLTSHWQTSGDTSYGDHLLFERLYAKTVEETDGFAEKLVGTFGESAVTGPQQAEWMTLALHGMAEIASPFDRALEAEKAFQMLVKAAVDALANMGQLSLGMDDMLRTMANDHETHMYLLQQRQGGVRIANALQPRDPVRSLMARYILRHPLHRSSMDKNAPGNFT